MSADLSSGTFVLATSVSSAALQTFHNLLAGGGLVSHLRFLPLPRIFLVEKISPPQWLHPLELKRNNKSMI